MWIDVTWGAGGSTADTTLSLCETAMDVTGLDVLMHLTCTNVTTEETRKVLQRCKDKGTSLGVSWAGKGYARWRRMDTRLCLKQ